MLCTYKWPNFPIIPTEPGQRSSEPVLEYHVIPRAKVIAVAQTKTLTEITVARPKLERDI